ncbi:MAG TPA: aminotransferase class I/II-fold pyridoxal phosphate-dependent enzyme [Candidatus Nitrosotalea sp.]|nr:aminotransferase class I/II-fold pyridoxal phosphate-dependent enzyme [Candidatus Nitrosotalea sp.]
MVPSRRLEGFTESVIREMTRLNLALHGPERAINFAQGFPDFEPPEEIVAAAHAALDTGGAYHQYSPTWGAVALRSAVAARKSSQWARPIDPDTMVTVTCGATEAMIATMLSVVEPGDEVVIFEPHYENYGPDCILSGATPRPVLLRPPRWEFDPEELRAAFGPRTRAIVVNTPHNPSGKVFSQAELDLIADLCIEHDCVAITDEIYEDLVYFGRHLSLANLPGMQDRTVTISGASKTYSVTGWRVGWVIAGESLTQGVRKVHDFLTVGAAHPLQIAVAGALSLPESFYDGLREQYLERRDRIVSGLAEIGFGVDEPAGAYYAMVDISGLTDAGDTAFARRLIERCAVASVPGSSFYTDPSRGRDQLRFSFPKRLQTIDRGLEALRTGLKPG